MMNYTAQFSNFHNDIVLMNYVLTILFFYMIFKLFFNQELLLIMDVTVCVNTQLKVAVQCEIFNATVSQLHNSQKKLTKQ